MAVSMPARARGPPRESDDAATVARAGCGAPAGRVGPDLDYLKTRLEQYKKTFPKYDMLGWYSTTEGIHDGDLTIHQGLSGARATHTPLHRLRATAHRARPTAVRDGSPAQRVMSPRSAQRWRRTRRSST